MDEVGSFDLPDFRFCFWSFSVLFVFFPLFYISINDHNVLVVTLPRLSMP